MSISHDGESTTHSAGNADTAYLMGQEIRVLVAQTLKLSVRGLEDRLAAHGAPISGLQYGILRRLEYGTVTLSELSRRFILDPSTLVRAIDALERKGYLRRDRDPLDRRRAPLTLTEAGTTLLGSMPAFHEDDVLMQALATLGPDRTAALLELLRELMLGMPDGSTILADVQVFMRTHLQTREPGGQSPFCAPPSQRTDTDA